MFLLVEELKKKHYKVIYKLVFVVKQVTHQQLDEEQRYLSVSPSLFAKNLWKSGG